MNDDQRFEQALEACLAQMRQSGRSAEEVLSDYPGMVDRLRPLVLLAADLQAFEPLPSPSSEFRSRLAADLQAAPLPHTSAATGAESHPPTESLVRALDTCLTRIQVEGADASVVLAEFPELADELRPLVATAMGLDELDPIEGPREAFRVKLANELGRASQPRSFSDETTGAPTFLQRLWRSTALTAAAAATVVLMLVFGAVYASADAQPGSWLYPFKRATEQARLWAVPSDQALWLRLGFAELRLSEALAAHSHAGDMLSDFSGEVTAALAEADKSLLAGQPQERFAPAMLDWLFDARTRLVDGRQHLPPNAWRGTLALVDEAIRAMQSGQLAVAPVPRLVDPSRGLRAAAPVSRPPVRVVQRRQPAGPSAGSDGAASSEAAAPERIVYEIVPRSVDEPGTSPVQTQPTTAPPRSVAPLPTRRPEPVPTKRPPTEPTRIPTEQPTEQPVPPTPPEVPTASPTAEPPATDPPTAVPSPTATDVPVTPTVPVVNKPPVIDQIVCDDQQLLLGKSTMCHVVAYDPEGEALSFLWSSDVPEMLNRTHKDATYFAAWGASGGVMTVRITVHVSDQGEVDPGAAGVTMAETYLEVHPPGVQNR